MRCEDYPCCGHTPDDPCERQPYDEPGYYDTTIPGQEHRLCDHENGECHVDEYGDDECDDEDHECDACKRTPDGWVCSYCERPCHEAAHAEVTA